MHSVMVTAVTQHTLALPLNGSSEISHFKCSDEIEIRQQNNVCFLPGTATCTVESLIWFVLTCLWIATNAPFIGGNCRAP